MKLILQPLSPTRLTVMILLFESSKNGRSCHLFRQRKIDAIHDKYLSCFIKNKTFSNARRISKNTLKARIVFITTDPLPSFVPCAISMVPSILLAAPIIEPYCTGGWHFPLSLPAPRMLRFEKQHHLRRLSFLQ